MNAAKLKPVTYDPLPIPTRLVNPTEFLHQSHNILELVESKLEEWESLSDNAVLTERCSLADLEASNESYYSDLVVAAELSDWHFNRIHNGTIPSTSKSKRAGSASVEPEGREESFDGSMQEEEKESVTGPIGTGQLSERFLELIKDCENSKLNILKSIPEMPHFVRKTKLTDYNSLIKQVKPCNIPSSSSTESQLSNLIYTISITPISKTPIAGIRATFATRQQELILLGSNTLLEFSENILAGGDAVPVRITVESTDQDDDEEKEEKFGPKRKKMKWTEERRKVGTCFSIEAVLYGDSGDRNLKNYAETIHQLIDPALSTKVVRTRTKTTADYIELPALSVKHDNPTIQAHQIELSNRIPTPIVAPPNYTLSKKPLEDVRLGELKVRIGQPYWFVHQGNCEHIWLITSIRALHPSDPPPHQYPLTTFLSKFPSTNCSICGLEPISKVISDNTMLGSSPCSICDKCWDCVGGKEKNLEMIPSLSEY